MRAYVIRATTFISRSQKLHLIACILLGIGLTAALLTPDPFRAVRKTPFGAIAKIDDAILHCGSFAVLAFAVASFLLRVVQSVPLTAVVALATYGAATEFLQSFVPGRTCDPSDALANMLGITFGMILTRFVANSRLWPS